MIICICRNLNGRKIDTAIGDGARTPAQVMAHHGVRFNCGQCRCAIQTKIDAQNMLDETTQPNHLLDLPTAAE